MARNISGLKIIKKGELSTDEAKRRGSLGGKARGETMKRRRTFKEMFETLLDKTIPTENGEKITALEAIGVATAKKALAGDIKAAQFIRDTLGQMPALTINNESPAFVQRVFITKEEQAEVKKHIKDTIENG